jgi:hypothetical protein
VPPLAIGKVPVTPVVRLTFVTVLLEALIVLFVSVCGVSISTDFSAGYVTNTVLLPAAKLTADPELDDSRIVFLASVVPEAVYVPMPTSQSPVVES